MKGIFFNHNSMYISPSNNLKVILDPFKHFLHETPGNGRLRIQYVIQVCGYCLYTWNTLYSFEFYKKAISI